MAKTREIKGRMKAIANIERITKTMKMIATARFQSSLQAATDSQPFSKKIAELVAELSARGGTEAAHPLMRRATDPNRQLLLVITSNRGLCGGYNAGVLRLAAGMLREHPSSPIEIEVVGKKGVAYFRFTGTTVSASHTQLRDQPSYGDVEQLASRYMQQFTASAYDRVSVAYMSFQSVARQKPAILPLLPLEDPSAQTAAPGRATNYEFSPLPQELLNELLPAAVKARLFQCFNEAVVGEHIARMVAMKNATDSAQKMGKELTRRFNRARQTAITTELSEIIGGAAALQ